MIFYQLRTTCGNPTERETVASSPAARKGLPLTDVETALWHDLVIAVSSTGALLDEQPSVHWLSMQGWSQESARGLHERFVEQLLLLSRYQASV